MYQKVVGAFQRQKIYMPVVFGFSIGEVLLASFVLTTGLLSVAALISSSYQQSLLGRNAIIATELAQEGVELVRNVRDNNIASDPSNPFDGFPIGGLRHCRMSYDDLVLDCSNAAHSAALDPSRYVLEYTVAGVYKHTGALGAFYRYIFIDYNGTDSAMIRSFAFQDPALYSPPVTGDASGCNTANKCAYTEVVLTDWK